MLKIGRFSAISANLGRATTWAGEVTFTQLYTQQKKPRALRWRAKRPWRSG